MHKLQPELQPELQPVERGSSLGAQFTLASFMSGYPLTAQPKIDFKSCQADAGRGA